MNDNDIDLLLHRANPQRRHQSNVAVESALDELFDEIVATSRLRGVRPGDTRQRSRRGLDRPGRTVMTGVAAAAIVAVGAFGLVVSRGSDRTPGVASGTSGESTIDPGGESMSLGSPPMVLLDDTWEINYLNESPDGSSGFLTLSPAETEPDLGDLSSSVHISWSREQTDPSLVAVEQRPTTVLGLRARVFASAGAPAVGTNIYFVLVGVPEGNLFIETGAVPDRADLDALLATLHEVDLATFEEALPDSVIRPEQRASAVNEMLAGIPLPPGFDIGDLGSQPIYSDQSQLGIHSVGPVVCGWMDVWFTAQENGDTEAADTAARAMASSHNWPVLLDMPEGGPQENVWIYADTINGDGNDGTKPLTRLDVESIFQCEWPAEPDAQLATSVPGRAARRRG